MDKMYVIAIGLLLVTGASVGVVAQNDSLPANASQANETDQPEPTDNESEEAGTITICHVPPGNPDARHTIEIGTPAWQAHEAHGDHEGACEEDAEVEDEASEDENETEEASEESESDANVSDEDEETDTQTNESETEENETEDSESEESQTETNDSNESES